MNYEDCSAAIVDALFEPAFVKERRRYAILQAAAVLYAADASIASTDNAVTLAVVLLDEVERREKEQAP